MSVKTRLQKVIFPACARELASQMKEWKTPQEKLVKGGARAIPFAAIMLVPQVPIVAEFITTVAIPFGPEVMAFLEERVTLWAASKTALFAGKHVDPWFDKKFGKGKIIEGEFVVRERQPPARDDVRRLKASSPPYGNDKR